MKKTNSSGFSIVEVLIAGTMIVGLMYALVQFFGGAFKAQKQVQNAVDFDIRVTQLNLLLTSRAYDGAFQGPSGELQLFPSTPASAPGELLSAPVPIEKIVQGSLTILDRNNPNLGGGLVLDRLEVSSAVSDGSQSITEGTPAVTTVYNRYLIALTIGAKKADGSLGSKRMDRSFSVKVLVDPSSSFKVKKCANQITSDVAPPNTIDMGSYWIDDANKGPLPSSGTQPSQTAHLDCNNRGMRLCDIHEIFIGCKTLKVSSPSQGICTQAGTSNESHIIQSSCNTTPLLGGEPGCGGTVYRCCKVK